MNMNNQKGYTLIELLVAAALGLLILGIVLAMYIGTNQTFVASQGVARSQEATRFAVHFLKRDITSSGFRDCSGGASNRMFVNDAEDTFPTSLQNAVFGWEFDGTDSGDSYTLAYTELKAPFTRAELATAQTDNAAAADKWTGNYIEGVPGTNEQRNLPALIAGFNPLRGSDVIAITTANPLPLQIQKQVNQRATSLSVIDSVGDPVASGVSAGSVLQIGDCSSVDIFQNSAEETDAFVSVAASGSAISPGNKLNADFQWQKKWGVDASVYESITKVYFIGTGAAGKPSLFVYETACGIAAGCGATQDELVEGVENMQILYGEDSDQNGTVDQYLSADQVVDFRGVRAVKFSLLVRSLESTTGPALSKTHALNSEMTITPPDDRNLRFVNSATVFLHNRGL